MIKCIKEMVPMTKVGFIRIRNRNIFFEAFRSKTNIDHVIDSNMIFIDNIANTNSQVYLDSRTWY